MCTSPNSKLVQRTIDLNYTNRKRTRSLKWILLNAVFLLIFVYDLSCKCPGYTSVLHYVEMGCAAVLAANLAQYAVSLAPSRATKLSLSPEQQKLLGLSNTDLDSSFVLTDARPADGQAERAAADAELCVWARPAPPPAPRTPPPPAPRAPPAPDPLADYLERCAASSGPAPPYQLAAADPASSKLEARSPAGSPRVWWRLALDPQRLTQFNLNLRLWIHITILERLVRELRAADEQLARLALCEAGALRGGRVPPARLRPLAAHVPALRALAPFLEPYADQRYLLRRLGELAQGGCLSAYRWSEGEPPDAELVLHLVATYLDGQLAGGFSAQHVAEAGAGAGAEAGAGRLCVVRVAARPPHYALALGAETLEVGGGRNNLLHTLLLFLAAAARRDPPALRRTHLGRAGLNMLWIIGR